jgi:hypothetical protein
MKTNQRVGKKQVVQIDSGREFPGLKGKVVKRVEIGKGEDHDLYIHVRFRDETELCFWLTSRIVIEEADLGDWKSGDFVQKRRSFRAQWLWPLSSKMRCSIKFQSS